MSSKTISEELFEQFCAENNIIHQKIETIENERRPDYEITINTTKIIVEVKQLEPNKEDIKYIKGLSLSMGGHPGERIRNVITSQRGQIKNLTQNKYSGILLIFNTMQHLLDYTNPYHVRTGMYGYDALVYNVPHDNTQSPYVADKKFGRNKKMTPNDNTSISAIAVLSQENSKFEIVLYHNIYAKIPIQPEIFKDLPIHQLTLEEKIDGKFQEWREIKF